MTPFRRSISDRDKVLFQALTDAAKAGDPTPKHRDLVQVLINAGHRARTCDIGGMIQRLKVARRVAVLNGGRGSNSLSYAIVGTPFATRPRDPDAEVAWPPEGDQADCICDDYSAASYDAAVAAGAFGFHEVRPKSREVMVHRPRRGQQAISYTGCSAAMEA